MKKNYEAHEHVYQKMNKEGIKSWDQRNQEWSIDPQDERFLMDVITQSWVNQKGKAIELGCGTGPLVRWLAEKKYEVTGIDISKTAIQMAKEQSGEYNCQYFVNDICTMDIQELGKYDLCIDGHFLHCITSQDDRKNVFNRIRQILNPGGIFVLMSMCFPVNQSRFSSLYKDQIILDNQIYVPMGNYSEIQDTRIINQKKYLSIRYLGQWQRLISEMNKASLSPMLVRFNHCTSEDPVSSLNVAAIAK
jgi:2-polyprenyl-3-methyl-5-hydroxy-6-metoxy-1,4-benzoquinol methylase